MNGRRRARHPSNARLNDQRHERLLHRQLVMGPSYGQALVAVAIAVPVGVFMWMLRPFAGEDTSLNVSMVASFSFAANIMLGASWYTTRQGTRKQAVEMNRMRDRILELERQLDAARSSTGGTVRPRSRPPKGPSR